MKSKREFKGIVSYLEGKTKEKDTQIEAQKEEIKRLTKVIEHNGEVLNEQHGQIISLRNQLNASEPNCVGKDFDFGSDELTCTNPDCQDKGACMK